MENYREILKDKIEASDMVLVGIGEDFGVTEKTILESSQYHEFLKRVPEENRWIMPYICAKMAEEKTKEEAYINLGRLLENKNYFIVSLKTDDIIYKKSFSFQKEKIVTPCGGIQKLQCEGNCNGKIYDISDETEEKLEHFRKQIQTGEKLDGMDSLKCPDCGKNLIFNQMGSECYCEEGYLPMWEKYTKWLQGTLNHKLCILELGVGMKYPSVIRWPFEKMAFFNQKACIFRIHHRLYQLTEEISSKGYAIAEQPMDFLVNSFE